MYIALSTRKPTPPLGKKRSSTLPGLGAKLNLGFSALAIGERVGHEAVDITYHYAHLFPTVQTDMAAQLETEMEALVNVRKE